MFTIRSMIRYSPCVGARAVSARERLHHTFSTITIAVLMKRKQLSLSKEDLNILIDALNTQWWIRYDPDVETTVVSHHKLFQRVIDAAKSLDE